MIEGVLESYENPWDLLAELAQNSMDAIRAGDTPKGDLAVHIDQKKRTIEWSDNGCGIDPADVEKLFVMYGTNKRGNPEMIGEKGVGIKFVIFSSSKFELTSHHANGSFELSVTGAADWLNSSDGDIAFQTNSIKSAAG
jgi:sensor histidine kinase regulating citrate/malate metabolism